MNTLAPLDTLYDASGGSPLPLDGELSSAYGELRFPIHPRRTHVIANFVSSLDGAVSLGVPGATDGDAVSGSNQHDSMVMGLLRAAADAIIIGASTLERSPQHIWTAEYVYPPLASAYRTLRQRMGKDASPLIVIVSGRGSVGPAHPVFSTREAQSVIVTTEAGSREITKRGFNPGVHLLPAGAHHPLSPREILDAVASERPRAELILVEGGPHLLGEFLGGERLDELFLTLSPQIAGRMNGDDRLALVAGKTFAPGRPLWARLVALKRAESHLFLRYAFTWAEQRS